MPTLGKRAKFATAKYIARQLAETYGLLKKLEVTTDEKLKALNEKPAYALFDNLYSHVHPYVSLGQSASRNSASFLELVAFLNDVNIRESSIGKELYALRNAAMDSEENVNANLEALLETPKLKFKKKANSKVLLSMLIGLMETTRAFSDSSSKKSIKDDLKRQGIRKNTQGHLELPYVAMKFDCQDCIRSVKKLAKALLDIELNKKTVRNELESIANKDYWETRLLKL